MEEKIQTPQEPDIDELYEQQCLAPAANHLHAYELEERYLMGLGECNDWVDPIFW